MAHDICMRKLCGFIHHDVKYVMFIVTCIAVWYYVVACFTQTSIYNTNVMYDPINMTYSTWHSMKPEEGLPHTCVMSMASACKKNHNLL